MGGVTVAVTADEIPHSEFFRNPGSLAELDSALEAYTYLEVMYFFFFFHLESKIMEPAAICIQTARQTY